MKRRTLALLVSVVLLLSLCAPAFASDAIRQYDAMKPATKGAMESGYVYACAESNDPTFVLGATAELSFKRRVATPSSSDSFIVEIYRGTASQLENRVNLPLVEKRTYTMSQFKSPNYTLTMSFKVGSSYSAGNYAVLWGIRNSAGRQYSGDYDYVMDMKIVSSAVPATGITCYVMKGSNNGVIQVGETLTLLPALQPENATTQRNFKASSSEPNVASVTKEAGYIYVRGLSVGVTELVITCGSLEKRILIGVGELNDFSMTPGTTRLCVGNTDTIRMSTEPYSSSVYFKWNTSDKSVATVRNGVVTAVGPGTATISAYCYGITKTVTYTVNYHQFSGNVRNFSRTATCPRQTVGHCSVCGKDNAANVYEPAIFTDTVYNAWYSEHVDFVYANGLMNGTSASTFAPNMPVTRGMVVTVLYRISGQPTVWGSSPFPDVPEGKYYTNAVNWAEREGIVEGFSDGKYHPDENVTREQLATILYRYSIANGESIDGYANLNGFPDYDSVHNYARQAIGWAVAEGIITGVGKDGRDYLQPANSATRAQFATIISRYLQRDEPVG